MKNNLTLKILIIIILCNLCFGVEKNIDTTEFPEELKQIVDSDTLPNYDKKAKEKEINDIIVENSLIIEEMYKKLDKYEELRKYKNCLREENKEWCYFNDDEDTLGYKEYSIENKKLIKTIYATKSGLVKITTYDLDNGSKELEFDNENRKNSSYTADVSFGNLSFVLKNKKIVKDIKLEFFIEERKSTGPEIVKIIYDSKGKKKSQREISIRLNKG